MRLEGKITPCLPLELDAPVATIGIVARNRAAKQSPGELPGLAPLQGGVQVLHSVLVCWDWLLPTRHIFICSRRRGSGVCRPSVGPQAVTVEVIIR
jgi:hypothetical protein